MTSEGVSVLKIHDVLLVTIPSESDDASVSLLQEEVLKAMERYEAKGLVLDISTVETLDSYFARTITETGEMVRLMGGSTIIAGMQASVAVTVTQLGLTLGNTRSALTVEDALHMLDHAHSWRNH